MSGICETLFVTASLWRPEGSGKRREKEESVQDRPLNVMLDPSLLLDAEAYGRARERWGVLMESEAHVFVPTAFVAFLGDYLAENLENETVERFFSFYVGDRREWTSPEDLARDFEFEGGFGGLATPFTPHEDEARLHEEFHENLREELEMTGEALPFLADAIFEEWVFLQERSWGISHTTAAFGWMARAGGVVVQAGKRGLDRLARKTLDKDARYELETADRLLALGKWVAFTVATGAGAGIGATAGAGVGAPILGSIIGTVGGKAIFMIDP